MESSQEHLLESPRQGDPPMCAYKLHMHTKIHFPLFIQANPSNPSTSRWWLSLGSKKEVLARTGHQGDFWGAGHVCTALALIIGVHLLG